MSISSNAAATRPGTDNETKEAMLMAREKPEPGSQRLEAVATRCQRLREQLGRIIVGQRPVIDRVIQTVFCGGHAILTGVPGLAKTLLVRCLARAIHLSFSRIQFTPDLMPSDITGTEMVSEDPATGKRTMEFLRGPIFANLVLADEINRTPPKTQAAMLQVMEEREITVGGATYRLASPFHVFATQNPLEMEGTYNLPEAQSDRFMFNIRCPYPETRDEIEMVWTTTGDPQTVIDAIFSAEEIMETQRLVRSMPVSREVVGYAVRLASGSRPEYGQAPAFVRELVRWGAGPRASQFLIIGAKAQALLAGNPCVEYADVRSVSLDVLRHRVVLAFRAKAQRISVEEVIERLLKEVPERG